ncbi:MAG: rhamnogalacturonan lyase [Phycisphaerales bacterium]|nr:MAG: rhamnogalacturonan lyase [Phycisphaerales bacterium]
MKKLPVEIIAAIVIGLLLFTADWASAQRHMEHLDRGVVAVLEGRSRVYVGWRLLGTEPEGMAFNVYRDGVRLNAEPMTDSTNFVDARGGPTATYTVCPVVDSVEGQASAPVSPWQKDHLAIALQTPEGYRPNDASAGDLDGDGMYDIVLHQAGRSRDNASRGTTDPPILEAYKLDGTFLWRINLGRNIREGAHYTQFMVYDLDGDGRAEVACKTADGTVDGQGVTIGDAEANWVNGDGKILDGPEFFTIFDGQTGAALATADYVPARGDVGGWGGVGGNGSNDHNGNRADRFLACVAYLDGERPSVVMCRGYYGRSVLAAWDWREGKLTLRWVFDSAQPGLEKYSGQGNHNLSVVDVDADGKDEIIYGSMCVDDDGMGLYSTDLRHGDAMHVSDLDPERPGLEVWGIHENEVPIPGYENGFGAALFDARTGEILWGKDAGLDVGRGVAADIDPRYPGAECWGGAGGLRTIKGEDLGPRPWSQNFLVWWDGDLLRETLNSVRVGKWDWASGQENIIFTAAGCSSNNGSKSTPALSADLLGDWREEVIWRSRDNKELRLYTTTVPTSYRFPTLMHDPQYRLSIAWQNVAYNQPPHVGFYLGTGMAPPPRPDIVLTGVDVTGGDEGRP